MGQEIESDAPVLQARKLSLGFSELLFLIAEPGTFLQKPTAGRTPRTEVHRGPSSGQKYTGHPRATSEAHDSLEGCSVLPPGRPEGLAWGPGAESISSPPHPCFRGHLPNDLWRAFPVSGFALETQSGPEHNENVD